MNFMWLHSYLSQCFTKHIVVLAFMLTKQWLQLVVIQDACLPSGATWGSPSRPRTHSDRQLENVIFFYMCEEDCPFLFLTVSKTLKILYFDCKDVLCLPHLFLRIFRGDVSPRQTRKLRGKKRQPIYENIKVIPEKMNWPLRVFNGKMALFAHLFARHRILGFCHSTGLVDLVNF